MPRIIKIDIGLRNATGQQHPRARPVEVTDKLRRVARIKTTRARRRPVPLLTRHEDSVHRRGPAGCPP